MDKKEKKTCEEYGWTLDECAIESEKGWEIGQFSPAGEYFAFRVEDKNFAENVRKYADEFRPETYADMYFEPLLNELSDALIKHETREMFSAEMKGKWVVVRSYNFSSEVNVVEFDNEADAERYMRNWYLRDLESERKVQAEYEDVDLKEDKCSLSEHCARIAWQHDEDLPLELCEYSVVQVQAPDPNILYRGE